MLSTKELIEEAKKFCDTEYRTTVMMWNFKHGWYYHNKDMAKTSIQRCLGVVQFIQTCGVPYEEVNWYDELREKYQKEFFDT